MFATQNLLSRFFPRAIHIRVVFQVQLSYQFGGKPNLSKLCSKSSFTKCFPICQEPLYIFTDNQCIAVKVRTIFHPKPDCNNTPDVPSCNLCTALSPLPSVSGQWSAHTMINCPYKWLWTFSSGSNNFRLLLPVSCEAFVLLGKELIVSRSDFVIRCDQITKFLHPTCCFTNELAVMRPCHVVSQAYFAISTCLQVSIKAVLPGCHFCRTFWIWIKRTCASARISMFEVFCELV